MMPLLNLGRNLICHPYVHMHAPYTQSKNNAALGVINEAKKQGMIAAYLNVAAIIAALVAACVIMGLVLGLYGPVYARDLYCANPSFYGSSYSYSSSSSNYQRYCLNR